MSKSCGSAAAPNGAASVHDEVKTGDGARSIAHARATLNLTCGECGAALVLPQSVRTTRCVYCASPNVIDRPPTPDRPDPSLVLPFVVSEARARSLAREWLTTRGFFREPRLKAASVEDIRSVYLPAYLVSAAAHTTYRAEIGEDYQEIEHYTDTDEKGNTVHKTRTVTRTEWRELAGTHASYIESLVSASRGLPNHELESVEPFDFRKARRFAPALVSGWTVEEPSLTLASCKQTAHDEILRSMSGALESFMPGDSHRELSHSTTLHNESCALTLTPIWVLAARFDRERDAVRLVLNGQSGTVYGVAPYSAWRITMAVVCFAVAVALGVLASGSR